MHVHGWISHWRMHRAGFHSSLGSKAFPVGKIRRNDDGKVAAKTEAANTLISLNVPPKVVLSYDTSLEF